MKINIWGYFTNINSSSSINMVACLKCKWIIKEELVILSKLSAMLHVVIERGHKDE
jgi:hypothetical protein